MRIIRLLLLLAGGAIIVAKFISADVTPHAQDFSDFSVPKVLKH